MRPVVIADADQDQLKQAYSILAAEGFSVFLCSSGEDMVDLVRRYDPSVVFFGHPIAPLSGFDAVRRLQGLGIHVPVVLMMEERTSDLLMHASKIGVTHFLQKPIAADRLLEMARRLSRSDAVDHTSSAKL